MCDAPDFGHMTGDARKRRQEAQSELEPDACCGRDGWPDCCDEIDQA